MKRAKTKSVRWQVVLKDGSDWNVFATSAEQAIKRVRAGFGRQVGQYMQSFRTDRALRHEPPPRKKNGPTLYAKFAEQVKKTGHSDIYKLWPHLPKQLQKQFSALDEDEADLLVRRLERIFGCEPESEF